MVVYAEYLFLENFITGIIILVFTGKISGLTLRCGHILFGGALCGIVSFSILGDLNTALSVVIRLIFPLITVSVAFPEIICGAASKKSVYEKTRHTDIITGSTDVRKYHTYTKHVNGFEKFSRGIGTLIKAVVVFYTVSFIMGGITIAVINASGVKGVTANGYIYTGAITYFKITVGVLASYLICSLLIRYAGERMKRDRFSFSVDIRLGINTFMLTAYRDTGNHLKDPVNGLPVSVISKSAADAIRICMPEEEMKKRYCIVPFTAAGTKMGIMEGFRADELMVHTKSGKSVFSPAVFAVYEGDFKRRDGMPDIDVLLNREITEGGVI